MMKAAMHKQGVHRISWCRCGVSQGSVLGMCCLLLECVGSCCPLQSFAAHHHCLAFTQTCLLRSVLDRAALCRHLPAQHHCLAFTQ
eukprot:1156042-Pelagomonas_calceolata.AAC.1